MWPQSVRDSSCISSKIPVISGVPRRSVLSPTLFLIYIIDATDVFGDLSASLSLFADDLKLYTCYIWQSYNQECDCLDSDLGAASHVRRTVSCCFAALRQLRHLRRYVTNDCLRSLVV